FRRHGEYSSREARCCSMSGTASKRTSLPRPSLRPLRNSSPTIRRGSWFAHLTAITIHRRSGETSQRVVSARHRLSPHSRPAVVPRPKVSKGQSERNLDAHPKVRRCPLREEAYASQQGMDEQDVLGLHATLSIQSGHSLACSRAEDQRQGMS